MNYITYLRVSTKKQARQKSHGEKSPGAVTAEGATESETDPALDEIGLGLKSQRESVEAFARQRGAEIIREFIEIESGKKADRPILAEALAFAKRAGACLVVAKLDRLARNVHFLSGLMESKVDFLAVDNPNANRLTIHILAAMAEYERECISARTKAALAQLKAQGVPLGSARPGHWDGHEEARRLGVKAASARSAILSRKRAAEEYADLLPAIQERIARGFTLQKIADEMNAEGCCTRGGAKFTPTTVRRIIMRSKIA